MKQNYAKFMQNLLAFEVRPIRWVPALWAERDFDKNFYHREILVSLIYSMKLSLFSTTVKIKLIVTRASNGLFKRIFDITFNFQTW